MLVNVMQIYSSTHPSFVHARIFYYWPIRVQFYSMRVLSVQPALTVGEHCALTPVSSYLLASRELNVNTSTRT